MKDNKRDGMRYGLIVWLCWLVVLFGLWGALVTVQNQLLTSTLLTAFSTVFFVFFVCLAYVIKTLVHADLQVVQKVDSDFEDASVGDVVELSGTVVADDSTDPSLFGHKAPLVEEWGIEEAFNLHGETRWQTIESGQRTDSFSIRSTDGREATLTVDGVFENAPYLMTLDFGRKERSLIDTSETIPSDIDSFLRQESIDVTEARNRESTFFEEARVKLRDQLKKNVGPLTDVKTDGTLRFTQSKYLKDGEDLFIVGTLKSRNGTEPDEIGFDQHKASVIANENRQSYIDKKVRRLYAAATFIIASLFFGALAFFAANPSVITSFL